MKVENNQQPQPNMQQQMDQMLQQPGQAQPVQPMQPMNGPAKKKKKCNVPAIVLGVVAVLGVGVGVYFGMQYFGEKDRADKLAQQNTNTETNEVESREVAEVATTKVDSSKYIYIGEWGYKIKVPDDLKYVSYVYKTEYGDGGKETMYTSINVWGVGSNATYLPSFANISNTYTDDGEVDSTIHSPLGVIAREKKNDSCVGGCPDPVFEDDNYKYTYYHPQAVDSKTKAEQDIEVASVEAIRKMLSDKANYSKI